MIICRLLSDESRPIEQAEQSERLSHWQRYLANDAQSEWAAHEMQVRPDFIPKAGFLKAFGRHVGLPLFAARGRGHVDDFTQMARARPGHPSLFRNQQLCSDSTGPAAWSRNLC